MRLRLSPRRLVGLGALTLAPALAAQSLEPLPAFEQNEVMIPMRDGARLHTLVFTPAAGSDSLPILITRTPYGIGGSLKRLEVSYAELARDGYIFVFQDIRGRYGSEGDFQMNRPLHDPSDSAGVDEATDTYDTVDWLVHHVPRALAKVGVVGISYPGWLAAMAGVNPHPAVKAISPQAPMTDTWMGVVKLIDVYPDSVEDDPKMGGYELMVASEILRGRYRTGFDRPTAIRPGRIEGYRVELHQQSYRFLKGHRIMVQVQSTWFPLYDRNPQRFVPNIFAARSADFHSATQRVYRSARHPSHVTIPVLTE